MPVFRLDRIYARGLAIVDAHVHYAFPSGRISDHAALAATFDTENPGAMNRFLPGNRITLLRSGGEYFPSLVAAIDGAEREVWLETYIYADDDVGAHRHRRARPGRAARHPRARARGRVGREALPHRRDRARVQGRAASSC